jgi:ubiquinone/menaquinone biosynthesis C-methylase UbiE
MSTGYRDEQRRRWDALAAAHGSTEPLQAVIGSSPLGNAYLDQTTKRFLGKLLHLRRSDVVLDYGCGVGRLSLWIAPQVREVIAMDISPKMVEVAKAKSAARHVDNTSFSATEGYQLPLEASSVNVVICGSVLKYILDDNDLGVLVEEFGRVLSPGGRVAVIEEIDQDGPTMLHGAEEIGETSRLRPESEYRELFARHGMSPHGNWPVYQQRVLRIYKRFGGGGEPPAWLASLLVSSEIAVEGLLRARVTARRGFRLLYYVREAEKRRV